MLINTLEHLNPQQITQRIAQAIVIKQTHTTHGIRQQTEFHLLTLKVAGGGIDLIIVPVLIRTITKCLSITKSNQRKALH